MDRCRVLLIAFCLLGVRIGSAQQSPTPLEFTRLIAHWDKYDHPEYLPFIEAAQPEVVQVGFYGAHFWSLAPTKFGKGYPAHFPKQGLVEQGNWFRDLNAKIHQHNAKVIGHFNMTMLVGDPDGPNGPTGFFHFYRNLWDEKLLGPKPVADPVELLEKDASGQPIVNRSYRIGGMSEHWASLANPHWRTVLKAWVKFAIAQGVDGLIANYFYRHNDLSPSSQDAFKKYLSNRFTPTQLRERFGIAELQSHQFDEIVGWHNPAKSSPLRREMLRFSQILCKEAFDEVFIDFGRSIKPNLIVAQWNHLGDFSQISGDERCMLPTDLWGHGEDYLWYSTGGSANFTDLEAGQLGEGTLQARYIQGAFGGRPFTLGKYEGTRIRTAIAELVANGGAGMGFYTRFTDPFAKAEIIRYYQFLKKYDAVYRHNQPMSEAVLIFPRTQVHQGNVAAVEQFKQMGKLLLDQHILFNVVPDTLLTSADRNKYRHIFSADLGTPTDPNTPPNWRTKIEQRLATATNLSSFDAPPTVRISASRPTAGKEITLHLVNYRRIEPTKKRSPGGGIHDEKPLPTDPILAKLLLQQPVAKVEFLTPESPTPTPLKRDHQQDRLHLTIPSFLVYAIVRIHLK